MTVILKCDDEHSIGRGVTDQFHRLSCGYRQLKVTTFYEAIKHPYGWERIDRSSLTLGSRGGCL